MKKKRCLMATVDYDIWKKIKHISWNKRINSNYLVALIIKNYIDDMEKKYGVIYTEFD